MRFSLRWLIALTLISSLWLYAVFFPYNLYVRTAFTVVVAALVFGTAMALASRRRIFWAAFVAGTALYGFLTLPPLTFDSIRPYLLTDVPLHAYVSSFIERTNVDYDAYRSQWFAAHDTPPSGPAPTADILYVCYARPLDVSKTEYDPSSNFGIPLITWNPNNIYFIAHAYFAVLIGFTAGFFAQWIRHRTDAKELESEEAAKKSALSSAPPAAQ